MQINFKKLTPSVPTPSYAKPGDAGLDLVATSATQDGLVVTYHTGIVVEIPEGYVGLLYPRSSIHKTCLSMCNSVGVIDSGYRGEIMVKFFRRNLYERVYEVGERVCQLVVVPYPKIELNEVTVLSDSERSIGGFGSTGT